MIKDKLTAKRIIKIVGNILVVLALILICKKLYEYEIDYSLLFQPMNMCICAGMSFVYGICVWACSYPWRNIVQVLTDKKINGKITAKIATKANLMKYLPGNIFQYIGKNELAIACELNHVSVASATVIDVVINLVAVGGIVVFLYWNGLCEWISYYGLQSFTLVLVGIVFLIVFFVVCYILRKKISRYLMQYKRLFSKEGRIALGINFLFYIVNNLCMALIYIIILKQITGVEIGHNLWNVIGAFILSWLMGFIIPGAPGGIGIRETVLTVLLGGILNSDSVLLAIVIFRVISVLGDLFGYGIACMMNFRHMEDKK